MTQKPIVVQVDGGIGRVICSLPALEQLSKKRRVIVLTSFPEVFFNNPCIYKAYNLNREYLWDDVIKHGEFVYPEPYFNHMYYNQKHHLIQSFNYILTGKAGSVTTGSICLTHDEKVWASEFITTRRQEFEGKKIVLLQCFGSGAKIEDNKICDSSYRSLPTEVVDKICENTNHLYINASHIHMNYANVWQQDFTTRQLIALTAYCDFIVSVDSFLIHAAAVFNKKSVVFFGGTDLRNLGYPDNIIIKRQGYPKNYVPNRFSGFVDCNKGALEFDDEEMESILKTINEVDSKEVDKSSDQ